MSRIYYPGELPNRGFAPHIGPMLPGTPIPTLVGTPQSRGNDFVALPGYGIQCGEAATNMLTDPQFSDVSNWLVYNTPTTREVGPQFAMDQGIFLGGLHIVTDSAQDGARQFVTLVGATSYTASLWCYVLSGKCRCQIDKGDATYISDTSTTLNQWERLEVPFVSTGTAGLMYISNPVSGDDASEFYVWMPQLEQNTYATPARVGTQSRSFIHTTSPIAETQTAWSIACAITPDFDYDYGATLYHRIWELNEDSSNRVRLLYHASSEYLYFNADAAGDVSVNASSFTWSRGDKIHTVVSCDGYNATLYINGTNIGTLVMESVQPTVLAIGDADATGGAPLNGVIDDFLFVEGCIPEIRVKDLYRQFKRGIPLHGLTDMIEVI